MKLISTIQGSAALRYSPDETSPDTAVLMRDLVEFVGKTYNFSLTPELQPGLILNPMFIFQGGELMHADVKIPITQITLVVGGLVVTAKDTDFADTVADDVVKRLDNDLGYKIARNIRTKYYQSHLVAEMIDFGERIGIFNRAEEILNKEMPRPEKRFDIKRLSFGGGDLQLQQLFSQFQIDDLPNGDFTIERRAGEPYSSNRFYCTAPMRTEEHVRVLGLIETAMRD
jgi:hypothetical protein